MGEIMADSQWPTEDRELYVTEMLGHQSSGFSAFKAYEAKNHGKENPYNATYRIDDEVPTWGDISVGDHIRVVVEKRLPEGRQYPSFWVIKFTRIGQPPTKQPPQGAPILEDDRNKSIETQVIIKAVAECATTLGIGTVQAFIAAVLQIRNGCFAYKSQAVIEHAVEELGGEIVPATDEDGIPF